MSHPWQNTDPPSWLDKRSMQCQHGVVKGGGSWSVTLEQQQHYHLTLTVVLMLTRSSCKPDHMPRRKSTLRSGTHSCRASQGSSPSLRSQPVQLSQPNALHMVSSSSRGATASHIACPEGKAHCEVSHTEVELANAARPACPANPPNSAGQLGVCNDNRGW